MNCHAKKRRKEDGKNFVKKIYESFNIKKMQAVHSVWWEYPPVNYIKQKKKKNVLKDAATICDQAVDN